jgi:hypothetical protein
MDEKNRLDWRNYYNNMKGFIVKKQGFEPIRFTYYIDDAPVTAKAFADSLPFTQTFMHARVSGQEVWTDNAPELDIIQENASVFTIPGEVVIGPSRPVRVSTRHAMGIYYGEGKGLDSCNIFAKVVAEDMQLLQQLGNSIWKNGVAELRFEEWEG